MRGGALRHLDPYDYFGGGGVIGNRYFMNTYGLMLFLMPPVESLATALVPWAVGALFTARIALNPFYSSFNPASHTESGPQRLLPVELTLLNNLPITTRSERVRVWFGTSPRFQVYFLDDNAYPREGEAFWVRGDSRTDLVLKAVDPATKLRLTVHGGSTAVHVAASVSGASVSKDLASGESALLELPLPSGFPYQGARAWSVTVSVSGGFVPMFTDGSRDNRFLGVDGRAGTGAVSTIAVVTSSPPFVEGGHLVIARSLVQALRQAGHDADLVLTPANRFTRQGSAYLANWLTDVGRTSDDRPVDQVISLRFPSYAVRHPRHVCWLNHTMRESYDLWDRFSDSIPRRAWLRERVRKRLIHGADHYLLARKVTRLFTISETVRRRLPWPGLSASVLYPPPPPRDYRVDDYEPYLFSVSRFTPLKRLDLVVEALAQPEAQGIRAVLAGDGEQWPEIAELVKARGLSDRVTLPGRLGEADLVAHLARCRAVVFAPEDEDYGFVTVEAFAASRPVITCRDSGGPAELVRHEESGLVVDPTPTALARAFRRVIDDRDLAARLGTAGRQRGRRPDVAGHRQAVAPVNWSGMAYRTPLEARIAKKTTRAITDFGLIENGDRVMIGLSGRQGQLGAHPDPRRAAPARTHRLLARGREHRLGLRGLSARARAPDVRRDRGWEFHHVPTSIGDTIDDRPRRRRHALLALRTPAPGRAVSNGWRGRRDQDRARTSRRRHGRDAAAERCSSPER